METKHWLSCWQLGFVGLLSTLGVNTFTCKALSQSTPSNIQPDNTLGTESSQILQNQNVQGLPVELIVGGATRGINLFHSFQEFNVTSGRGAYFLSPSVDIQNILARVTGGNRSEILGRLGTLSESKPNLFLINPNGMIFGERASLDVQGSFVGTTANGVQFGNQGVFSTTNPQTLPLLSINPSALLFNQINQTSGVINRSLAPAGVNLSGGSITGLRVPNGKSLLLIGGNVTMAGGRLNAVGGRVELGGLAEPGSINLVLDGDRLSLKFPENVARADVSLSDRAFVFVEGAGGGDIAVNARNLEVSGGSILSAGIGVGLGTPETVAGDIVLNARDIKVVGSGSVIRNLVRLGSKGNGGNITIDSGSFALQDSAQLSASTFGIGNGGNVTVRAKDAVSLADADIFSTVEAGGAGKGGNIDINAATLSLIDGAQLQTSTRGASATQRAARGDAGDVNVKVTGTVDIAGQKNGFPSGIRSSVGTGTVGNGGAITIDSGSFLLRDSAQLSAATSGQGNAGNVTVRAKDAVSLAGNAYIFSTVGASGVGKGGNIDINAATFSLIDGAQLITSTRGASATQVAGTGDAGNVNVKVTGTVDIAGQKNGFPSGIRSFVDTGTVGNGGNITIDSGSFSLRNGAEINASTFRIGNAGNVIVRAQDAVSLAGNAVIFSTVGAGGVGNGGNIEINAASLLLTDGAQLSASTSGQGNGGNVIVRAQDAVSLAGNASILSTVEASGVGKGGNIDINAAALSLIDGAQLLTTTSEASATQGAARGDAGNVNVKVTDAVDIAGQKNGLVSAVLSFVDTGTVGNGGNITINSGSFSLRDGAQLAASTFGQGNAGNITVRAKDAVSLADANILSTVEAGGAGNGGNIDINAATLSLIDGAQLLTITRDASANQPTGRGDAGNVNVKVSGTVDIAGQKNGRFSTIGSFVGTGTVGNGGNVTIDTGSFSLRDSAQINASTSGQGNAGNVTVRAKDAVSLAGNAYIFSTVEAGGAGNGGNIDINAATLSLIDGAQLQTSTRGASATQRAARGDAGNVNVKVTGEVDIVGQKNGFSSAIRSNVGTGTIGNGGDITIDSGSFSLRDGAQIVASTSGQGNGGNVTVRAKDAVFLAGNASILSTVSASGVGKGGNIDINAATLSLIDGAQLGTITRGASATQRAGRGDAGNVNVKMTGTVDIAGQKNGFLSGIFSLVQPGTVGNGGNITIDSGSFSLRDGAQTNASTLSNGRAGKITLNATVKAMIDANSRFSVSSSGLGITGDIEINSPKITLDNQGKLNAESTSGNGGNINLNSNLLLLRRGAQISTNAGTEQKGGDGGNININSKFIVAVPQENSDITANAFQGRGGNINITAQGIFGIEARPKPSERTNDITASSDLGLSGIINLNSQG